MTVISTSAFNGGAIIPPRMPISYQKYNYNSQNVIARKNYLHEAETEYLRMLDEAVEEIKKLIEEVNKISTILD